MRRTVCRNCSLSSSRSRTYTSSSLPIVSATRSLGTDGPITSPRAAGPAGEPPIVIWYHSKEWYQITIGGSPAGPAALGEVIGPSVPKDRVAETIGRLLEVYVRERDDESEQFLQTVRRIGVEPFRERVYETDHSPA